MKTVLVVTSVELGWDCIVGVFDSDTVSAEKLEEMFPQSLGYFIHDKDVETSATNYE